VAEAPLASLLSSSASSASSTTATPVARPWITNLGSIRPKAYWSIQSLSQPLPNWLPCLKNIRASILYEYQNDLKRLPSRLEGVAKFSMPQGDIVLKPSLQLVAGVPTTTTTTTPITGTSTSSSTGAGPARKSGGGSGGGRKLLLTKRYNLLVEASRGENSIAASLGPTTSSSSTTTSSGAAGSGARSWLRCLRGSFGFPLPYQTVSHVQVSPVWDLDESSSSISSSSSSSSSMTGGGGGGGSGSSAFSCRVEAVSGGAARTKALLHLEYQNPTLTVVHTLDNRNTVAPCICLYSGRIVYQWDLRLGRGGDRDNTNVNHSFLRTRVDPVSAIDFTWTDQSLTDGGLWETNVRLPLEGTTLEALAADVRIRRQFQF
jgi:hypothetical protein